MLIIHMVTLCEYPGSPRVFWRGSVLFIFLDFVCCPIIYVFTFIVPVVMSVTISAWKLCSVRLYLQLLVEGLMSYLRYLCLFSYSGVQHILCCFCFIYLDLVYPMLPVSLDCPYLIAPSVFSNVNKYLLTKLLSCCSIS